MLDGEFLDGGTEFNFDDDDNGNLPEPKDEGKFFSEGEEIDLSDDDAKAKEKAKAKSDDIDVDIVDDTPDEDRGKWVVDDDRDGEPEFPNEDEMKQYSKKVRERIKSMTARTHAERRAREAIERQLKEAHQFAERLYQQNQQLTEVVESGEKVLVGEHQQRLQGQLNAAKAAYREAAEAGDTDGQLAAQEELARLAAQLDRLSTYKPQPMPRMQKAEFDRAFAVQQQQQTPQPDRQAQDWQQKNRWFGRDEVMTAFAMGLHSQLVQREGIDPRRDSDEYYGRLDQELRKRFPEKFKQEQPRRRTSAVAPANRGVGGNPKKVTLTESQVKLAKKLGITPEQYARELIKSR